MSDCIENSLLVEILQKLASHEIDQHIDTELSSFSKEIHPTQANRQLLAKALILFKGEQLLLDKKFRNRLIDTMDQSDLEKIMAYLDLPYTPNSVKNYTQLQIYADTYIHNFKKALEHNYSKTIPDRKTEELSLESSDSTTRRGFEETFSTVPGYPAYPYQIEITKKVLKLIDSKESSRAIIHLPTGAGKTRTAMNIICEHLRHNQDSVVIWLANKQELCDQAQQEFIKAWSSLGNRRISSYSLYESSELSFSGIDSGVIVAGLQKLHSVSKRGNASVFNKLKKRVSLVVFDEAHQAIAPTYKESVEDVISLNKEAFVLGLSATPGRTFGKKEDESELENQTESENEKLAEFFHRNKVTMNVDHPGFASPINWLISEGYLAKPTFTPLEYDMANTNHIDWKNIDSKANTREDVAQVVARNKKIIETIKSEYESGNTVIVFACSVQHSRQLAWALCCAGVKAASIDTSTDSRARVETLNAFKDGSLKIIVNYAILTTGFDAPKTNVAFITRPTQDLKLYMQMAGRAMRGIRSEGNKTCTIYTMNDHIPEFVSAAKAFDYWNDNWEEK